MRKLVFVLIGWVGSIGGMPLGSFAAGTPLSATYAKYNYRANGAIQGHCTVAATIGDPLPSACKGLTLILKKSDSSDSDGEPERTQTSEQGNFKFKARNGASYVISCAPESCKLVSPQAAIHGGDLLDIRVEAKP